MRSSNKIAVGVLAGSLATGLALALPVVDQEVRLKLIVDVLPVNGSSSGASLGTLALEIPPGGDGEAQAELRWPAGAQGSHLRLRASGAPGPPGGEHRAALESWLVLPDGHEVHAARALQLREGTTRFLEVYGEPRQRLILAVEAELVTRSVVRTGATLGRPVRFKLEIERAEAGRSVPLETNLLDTFVGHGVAYSFVRGQEQDHESLRIVLTPLRVEGDAVEVEVRLVGSLPGSPEVLDRKERLLTTRGHTSSFTVASGPSPSGYRFLITPAF